MLTLKVGQGELYWRWKHTGNRASIFFSASPGGGWVFGFQALFEAAKQNAVAFVLLIFFGMELPLDLEATVHNEGGAEHREPVSGHMELTGLRGTRSRGVMRETWR